MHAFTVSDLLELDLPDPRMIDTVYLTFDTNLSDLVDQGYIRTTVGKNLGNINADNLKTAHAELESGRSIGKIVLQGF